jgi:hypothetical protein
MIDENDILFRLRLALSSSCTCLTKTPLIEYHDMNCRYRVLMEAAVEIGELRKLKEINNA